MKIYYKIGSLRTFSIKGKRKMECGNGRINKLDLAKRICSKNEDISCKQALKFITIICDEILDIVLNEKGEVFLPRFISIKLDKKQKHGFDFKTKKYAMGGEHYKLSVKPQSYLKEQVCLLNNSLNKDEV